MNCLLHSVSRHSLTSSSLCSMSHFRALFSFRSELAAASFSSSSSSASSLMHGTTILCVRKGNSVVMVGDGQVTMGSHIVKPNARKVRRIASTDVLTGFAGATADAMTLYERLELKLEEHKGQLVRSCVELAKAWRTDKYLRRLDATLLCANSEVSLTITGVGDVVEPHDGLMAVGSGGPLALAAARALHDTDLDAESIARKAMAIAADIDIYTNGNIVVEEITGAKGDNSNV